MVQDANGSVPPWGSPETTEPSPPSGAEPRMLSCPACSGTTFNDEEGRVETRWGMSKHNLTMKVCRRCSHVMFFYQDGGGLF